MDPAGAGAEFHIPSVGRQHGGSYSCSYRPRSEPFVSSLPSDPVELVVAEPSYPKPNITVQSSSWGVSLGGVVTIWCRGQRQGVRFVLNKEGRHFPPVDSVGLVAEFPISNVSREDGGSYSCSYHSRSEPFAVSYPSDPVELVVRDPSLPRLNISLSPTGVIAPEANVTIRCQGQNRDVRFFLHKAGDRNPQRHMGPAGAGPEFRIPSVGRQHGGNYSCSYRPRSEPFVSSLPSNTVQLVVAEREFLKPTIWVSPSRVVALGGNVTIRCEGQDPGMEFVLHKVGHPNMQVQTVPHGPVAEFPIPSVSREDGGNYTCDYRSITEPSRWSYPSDPVEIIVAEPSYPKPNITLQSRSWGVSLGGAVTIWCRGQHQGMRFVLNKERRRFPPVVSVGMEAEFPISNVSREHSGSYSCFYHSKSEPFNVSYPSDPVELVVREREFLKPTIWVSPSRVVALGGNVTIRCEGQDPGMEFVLRKVGHPNMQVQMVPHGPVAEFPISSVSQEDGGSYTCDYRSITEPSRWSYPSDPVEIIVAEPSYPKPNITLQSRSWGVSLGGAVTIWCRGQRQDVRFVLNKERRHFPPVDSVEMEAEFPISNVSRENSGSYNCFYHSKSEPFNVSYPSDPVELVVRDPSLPRPSISLSPTGVSAPGADVTIQCQGQRRDVRFFLHKAADLNPQRHLDPAGDGAEFRIPSVGRQHGGSYSCSYRPRSEPFVSSEPSDPVQLVVAEREFLKPTIWVSPSRVVALGGNVTIHCEGQDPGMEFVLRKAGHPNPQVQTVPHGPVAEFPIASVSREDGGTYTCEYRSITEQSRWSYLSDPVEIIVGEPSYPKPSISLSPSGGVSLGGAVTVQCWGQHQSVRFVLNKAGRHFPPVDSDGLEVVFSVSNVSRDLGGSYSCSYHSRSEPFTVSDPSDPVELVVRDPSLPRPSISLIPTWVNAPGADVTIRCEGQHQDMRFFLHKAGDLNPQRHMDPAGAGAEFRIPSMGQQHGGNYSCSYQPRSEPFVSSQPSDPVQLVVAGGNDLTQPGTTPASTRPGTARPGGTDPTQSETAPTSPCSGSAGPDTESKGSESPSTTPKTEGTTSAGPKQLNPTTTEPDGKGGNNLTQPGTTPASTRPGTTRPGGTDPTPSETAPMSPYSGSAGPDTESKGSESPSTTPKTEGTNSAGPKQLNPTTTEPDGKGGNDLTQPGTTPASTRPGTTRPGGTDPTPSETAPTSPYSGSAGPDTEFKGSESPSTTPKTEGTTSAGPKQLNPTKTEPDGKGGTDPTPSETAPTSPYSGSAGPDTESKGSESPSTTPKTGGTDPTQSETAPTSPYSGSAGPATESKGSESPSTTPKTARSHPTEGTTSAGPKQLNPTTTEPDGKGGTDPTQSETAPTSPCSGSAGPDTESKGSESPSTTPKTEGTTSAGPKQLNPTTMEPDGKGRNDLTQPATTPASTRPGTTRPGETDPTQSETAPTSPYSGSAGPDTESKGSESPSTTPKTEGTTSAGPKQLNPTTTEPDVKGRNDLTQPGMTPASTRPGTTRPGGTDPTQSETAPTSPSSGSAGPATESKGSESPSTTPKTEGTTSAGPKQLNPTTTEPDGKGGTDPTQSETAPTSSCSGSAGPATESKGSESPSTTPKTEGTTSAGPKQLNPTTTEPDGKGRSELKLSIPIIAAGLLLLLLLLAFLCYRRTRGRKGRFWIQSRESEPATTVYTLLGEGTQLDVLPQEPDPVAEGHTYTELDRQALQAKRGGPAPAPKPVLYTAIDVN
ncbi:basement membrane-specific heparan sulfate proteoglycan core protein-like isoform X4 [Mauremys reevesii]|uniref:basement membrane-specific heparan sulfate proteoglycan core protein-like isoform X4 n=1 Tax=Mauremys reevesii TaxID=260615 RepID=UPI00193F1B6B|nr:basement membrane-specific heparan sulfate proteoglycan core protein-like isoform X4 [Mauremys reevesii]